MMATSALVGRLFDAWALFTCIFPHTDKSLVLAMDETWLRTGSCPFGFIVGARPIAAIREKRPVGQARRGARLRRATAHPRTMWAGRTSQPPLTHRNRRQQPHHQTPP